jgi:hypothetical protein
MRALIKRQDNLQQSLRAKALEQLASLKEDDGADTKIYELLRYE